MFSFQLSSDTVLFNDRKDAGERLAQFVLEQSRSVEGSFVVYALPRGGVEIGAAISHALQCPLDVLVAKKITRPENPELAIGAVTADGQVLRSVHSRISGWDEALNRALTKAQDQLAQFQERPEVTAAGKIALLVDDGIATGMTISVAVKALRKQEPQEIWICAPVAPKVMIKQLEDICERVLVLATPERFMSVSRFYRSFPQVEMESAIADLKKTLQN
ncbi:MAG: phosphoribosyltransferase [Leptolyngbya sp. Prado105]|nr:phosphoribosyltransferase [Leptolyngbya sp. Prado105]